MYDITYNGYQLSLKTGAKFWANASNNASAIPAGTYEIQTDSSSGFYPHPKSAAACQPLQHTPLASQYELIPSNGLNYSFLQPFYLFDNSAKPLSGIQVGPAFFRCFDTTPQYPSSNRPLLNVSYSSPWMLTAKGELGQNEVSGKKANPRILSYFKSSKFWGTDDSGAANAWCASFVAWVMQQNGYQPPKNAFRAKAWSEFGKKINDPVYGAIGIKSRKGGGHVAFVVGASSDGQYLYMLGGNQDNEVNISRYSRSVWDTFVVPTGFAEQRESLPIFNKAVKSSGSES